VTPLLGVFCGQSTFPAGEFNMRCACEIRKFRKEDNCIGQGCYK
ncbi:hypothetical protein E2320_018920, partial [Naja naja]